MTMPTSKDKLGTRTDVKGQVEMTINETSLWKASEALIKAKSRHGAATNDLATAENEWVEEMKKSKLKKINHKEDIIQCVEGRTTKDHARFVKS